MTNNLSLRAQEILALLKANKNVLLVGPPGCGKSHVMSEVASAFSQNSGSSFDPSGEIPFLKDGEAPEFMPSSEMKIRLVKTITFHQGTKYRDFVGGVAPKLSGQPGFVPYIGTLLQANIEATSKDTTALVCIDEINRGPAVAAFGDTLTAIEKDKRLDSNNKQTPYSVAFHPPGENGPQTVYLSQHLYILAAMNESDTSVEPLDVAFQRRFSVVRLNVSPELARAHLGISKESKHEELPDSPASGSDVYNALFSAWTEVNKRIELGKGRAYLIGHGVLMNAPPPTELASAISYAKDAWSKIQAHALEVFFGNDLALAVIFNANQAGPYRIEDSQFGDQPVARLYLPESESIYMTLRQVAGK
jgi:5-methylcytosine-specific restriction protein B